MKKSTENVQENNSPKATPQNGVDLKDLKNLDLKKAVDQDLRAAIHFLCLIRDTPELQDVVLQKLEQLLQDTIKLKEKQPEIPFN